MQLSKAVLCQIPTFQLYKTLWPEFPRRNPAKQVHTVHGTAVRQGDYSWTFTLNERTLNTGLWQFDWALRPNFMVVCRHLYPTPPNILSVRKKVIALHHLVKVWSYWEGISPLGFALTSAIRPSTSLFYCFLSANNGYLIQCMLTWCTGHVVKWLDGKTAEGNLRTLWHQESQKTGNSHDSRWHCLNFPALPSHFAINFNEWGSLDLL